MRINRSTMSRLLALAAILGLAACAAPQSYVLVGTPRTAISPADVKIYSHPPPTFEEIAMLNASSNSVFSPGGQSTVDKVIERLKEQAAKLGANGIILEGFSDRETGSLGTGVGSSSVSSNSAVGVGVGGSLGIYKKSGQGRAIYVPPG
jgi:uncharacterized protein YbjQ (UPF0145 family)